ncbi:MAG: carbon-nitrogen hydrolase family protein [Planctomycetes bacterium]|nr:carbon-nitrogen hydrolase family protein [Planctomycetota bacterium]
MQRTIVGAVQMTSGPDKARNLATAVRLVEEAAARGAQLIALPELFNCLADSATIVSQAEPVPGPTSLAMSELAARLQVTLLAGSIAQRVEGSDKVFNASLLFSPKGEQLACYRKIHLFDIDLPGQITFQESGFMQAGDRLVVTETAIGRLGQATCYDLRFPELFRRLVDAGADVLCVPSAFTLATGRDHWQPLLRVRAIENQTYVIASNQYGNNGPGIVTYGRSAIIDPWGVSLAIAADGETVITAEIDLDHQAEIRERLPALRHRRNLDEMNLDVSNVDPE